MKQGSLAVLFLALFSAPTHRLESAQSTVARSDSASNRAAAVAERQGQRAGSPDAMFFKREPQHPARTRPRPLIIPDSTFRDRDVSVTVEQTQSKPAVPAEKAAAKKYYVPPRWMATDQGVEVLMPGFWTDDPELAGMKRPGTQRVLREY